MSSNVESDEVMTCSACGASVYREHIHRGLAGMWAGQILCPTCLKPVREGSRPEAAVESLDSLPLTPTSPPLATEPGAAGEQTTSEGPSPGETGLDMLSPSTGPGARHVRTFHAKLSEAALHHLDEQMNAWLKRHPEVEIRFANTTVGVFEGKHSEPNLVVTVFY
jgi:hypothetical protein